MKFLILVLSASLSFAQNNLNPKDLLTPKNSNTDIKGALVKSELKWFTDKTHQKLILKQFEKASDSKPTQVIEITDVKTIQELKSKIQKLPVEGEKMVSWTPDVPLIEMHFISEHGKETLEFYQGQIKTPGTSFYTAEKDLKSQQLLFVEIKKLLKN